MLNGTGYWPEPKITRMKQELNNNKNVRGASHDFIFQQPRTKRFPSQHYGIRGWDLCVFDVTHNSALLGFIQELSELALVSKSKPRLFNNKVLWYLMQRKPWRRHKSIFYHTARTLKSCLHQIDDLQTETNTHRNTNKCRLCIIDSPNGWNGVPRIRRRIPGTPKTAFVLAEMKMQRSSY